MAGQTNNSPTLDDGTQINPVAPSQARDTSIIPLPIRGEKRIVPSQTDPAQVASEISSSIAATGNTFEGTVSSEDFYLSAAKKTFTDYILVRIPGRGADGKSPFTFRFLINPKTIAISKQTLDAQSMTRSGWQYGIWGEDVTEITMQGNTAGQYFSLGTTDNFEELTLSYQNVVMLTMVFENNGYFFEGEKAGEGPMAADYTRRRIQMHQDVELTVGNYIWFGMFTAFNIQHKADCPFTNEFSLTFVAWKERYRSSSGFPGSITNNIQRGHSPSAVGLNTTNKLTQSQINNAVTTTPNQVPPAIPPANNGVQFAGVPYAAPEQQYTTDVADFSPTSDITGPSQFFFGGPTQGGS